jgi:predicted  nucleic acid-binding Zn-ribbon protein
MNGNVALVIGFIVCIGVLALSIAFARQRDLSDNYYDDAGKRLPISEMNIRADIHHDQILDLEKELKTAKAQVRDLEDKMGQLERRLEAIEKRGQA